MNTYTNYLASTTRTQEKPSPSATTRLSSRSAAAPAPTKEKSAMQTFLAALMRSLGALAT